MRAIDGDKMLEKYTFRTDEEVNGFFRNNPDVYLVKMIIAGGEQHIVVTRMDALKGRDHLATPTLQKVVRGQQPRGGGNANFGSAQR